MTRLRTVNNRQRAKMRGPLPWYRRRGWKSRRWSAPGATPADITRDLQALIGSLTECHCIPGHRSTVLTHACQDCGFRDCDYFDGKPVPPCGAATASNELASRPAEE